MIVSLAPLTFALAAAVSTGEAPDSGSPGMHRIAAPVRACATVSPSPCALRHVLQQQQQSPPQEEKPPEKSDPRRKGGAGEQVRRYVDEHAPKIAGWLFDSPTQSTGLEGEPLRNRGLRNLPPVAGEQRVSNSLTVLDDLGFVIAGAEPKIVYVVSIVPATLGVPVNLRPNDVILAINGHAVETPQSFRSRYMRLRPGQAVELAIRRGDQRLTVPFYKPGADRLPTQPSPSGERAGGIIPG